MVKPAAQAEVVAAVAVVLELEPELDKVQLARDKAWEPAKRLRAAPARPRSIPVQMAGSIHRERESLRDREAKLK
jgi:hypothetical protein